MTDQPLPPAINPTEQRLDLILDELRALRSVLAPAARAEPEDGEAVELRESVKPIEFVPELSAPLAGSGIRGPEKSRKRR